MTKYYVRYIPCGYLTYEGVTHNEFLYYDSATFATRNVRTHTDIISSETDNVYVITEISGTTYKSVQPRDRISDVHLELGAYNASPLSLRIDYCYPEIDDEWYNDFNWSNPNTDLSAFQNELCNYFETAKVADSAIYGEDNDEVNLYLLSFGIGIVSYFPFFKKGKDSNYDQIIEV